MCWISNAHCNDPIARAPRRTVVDMKERTDLPFRILGNQSRERSRMWATAELKRMSAKALRPSSWDSSFGDSEWGIARHIFIFVCAIFIFLRYLLEYL